MMILYEIKASNESSWEKDALMKAISYVLMTAKTTCTIVLLNPFMNVMYYYNWNAKNVNTVRHYLMYDVALWNLNCHLTKTIHDVNNRRIKTINIEKRRFIFLRKEVELV